MFNQIIETVRASKARARYSHLVRGYLRDIHGGLPGNGRTELELEENLIVSINEALDSVYYGYYISLCNRQGDVLGHLFQPLGYQMALNLRLDQRLRQLAEQAVAEREQARAQREQAVAEQRVALLA